MPTGSTRRKRKFGKYMRKLRTTLRPDLKPETLADLTEVKRPTISRMETGVSLPGLHLFKAVLDVLEADEEQRARARQLWDHANADKGQGSDAQRESYRAFKADEADAVWEKNYQHSYVPGCAQVDSYVAALAPDGEAVTDEHLAERRERRNQVRPPRSLVLHLLLDQAVVEKIVGGVDTMIEQLLYLVEIAALPNVTLQIVEHSAGAYSLLTGSVVLLGYEDDGDDESKSAYVSSHGGGVTLEDADEVEALATQFEAAVKIALSHDDSVKFVERRIEVLRGAAGQS